RDSAMPEHRNRVGHPTADPQQRLIAPTETPRLTNRHRINRSGDRQLNRALHTITLIRARLDPTTRAYVARRISEGKTARDAQRCLKRAVCRQLFKLLERGERPTQQINAGDLPQAA
ncbi:transposase, partial [Streptomyces sp. AK02-04a]|uniref:transposase n=1 Tax=Streptomyces sp. AK02-04a TaxID=3028649 RepID=UPI0029B90CDC